MTLLPLFRRELIEIGSRRRTFVTRAAFAVLFSGVILTMWSMYTRWGGFMSTVLGRGRELHHLIMWLELLTVALLVPLVMAATFPSERERGSFELLRLTRLSAVELVVETFLVRIVHVLSILLLLLPMRATAYSLGGVTTADLWTSWYLVSVFALQIGAVAMLFASRASRPVPAYIAVVATLAAVGFLVPWLSFTFPALPAALPWLFSRGGDSLPWFALSYLDHADGTVSFAEIVRTSWPVWIPIVGCIAIASLILPRSASMPRRFGRSRRTRVPSDERGIAIARRDVPPARPIAWREARRARTIRRWAMFAIWPIAGAIVVGIYINTNSGGRRDDFAGLAMCCWAVHALAMVVLGVNAIVSERTDQTLDTLLTTPITSERILADKCKGLMPAAFSFAAPIIALLMLSATEPSHRSVEPLGSLLYGLMLVALYTPIFVLIGVRAGLRAKRKMRALAGAVITLIGWTIAPLMCVACAAGEGGLYGMLLSPAIPPVVAFVGMPDGSSRLGGAFVLSLVFYGCVLVGLVAVVRADLDKALGRAGG